MEISFEEQVKNAYSTRRILGAIKGLKDAKGKYDGSGFILNIKDLSGKEICNTIYNGENLDLINHSLILGLEEQLISKQLNLKAEVSEIDTYFKSKIK